MSEAETRRSRTKIRSLPLSLTFIAPILLAVGALCCNQPFDPRGPVDEHLVVFTVLSTDRNTQFVSVTSPFLPSGFGTSDFYSSDVSVSDAMVTISAQGEYYRLSFTTVARPDSSQFTSPLRLYMASRFTPHYATKYTVSVSSAAHGDAAASVILPGKPTLWMAPQTYFEILQPFQYAPDSLLTFEVMLSGITKGFLGRLFIDFDVFSDSGSVRGRVQMPISTGDTTYSLTYPEYPQLRESPTTDAFLVSWKIGYLQKILKDRAMQYAGRSWAYKQVVLQVLQADANLYSYYVSAQVNQDPHSIRLDQPLYPTISGGSYGMVGGYTLDSLVFIIAGQ